MKQTIITASIILGISYIVVAIIKLPPAPLPTVQQIEAKAKVEQEKLNLVHKNQMEYQEAKNREPVRPLTEEELDSQTISVPEAIGLKLLFN